jgi:hypothetical protein
VALSKLANMRTLLGNAAVADEAAGSAWSACKEKLDTFINKSLTCE